MANDHLEDSLAKVERAQTQIEALNAEVRRFIDKSSYDVVSKFDADRDEEIWSFRLREPVPRLIAVLIGEILHNLRSSLDQMACAVALQHSGSSKETYFPFGADATIFETELARKGKKLPSDAHDMIRTLKPYKGGNDLLWNIHYLNRADKHIHVVPINLSTSANTVKYVIVKRGLVMVLGHRKAKHLYYGKPRPSAAEIAAMPSPTSVYVTDPGFHIVFGTEGCSPEESFDFLVSTPGAEFDTDMKPTIDVAFENVEGIKLDPVVAVVNQMRQLTERILLSFRGRFF
jgi:hypothetical protein